MYFTSILRMFEQKIPTDSYIFRQLVGVTLSDGGTWPMALNILNKYGIVPKSEFPETLPSSDVKQLSQILRRLLLKHTAKIEQAVTKKIGILPEDAVTEAVSEVQGFVTLAYGIPPGNFTWTHLDKEKNLQITVNTDGLDFFKSIIRPIIDPNQMISLVSDDRPKLKKGKSYIIQMSGLFAEQPSGYICNVDQSSLEDSIVKTVKKGFPVWISVDFNRFRSFSQSVLDIDVHNYKLLNGLKYPFMNKTLRSSFRSSIANHAVLITDVAVDSDDRPNYYRVENSHGVLGAGKGFLWMSRDWFREFGTEAVVLKSTLSKNASSCLDDPGMLLPIWDCLGAVIRR
ncbi:hypothetical protein GJ496_011771 [Pomphorhynchus laevis]|nr:hypothetical protein GJ496_011771 [Pomphorhynchus laevis]